jgi:hypothetical protein
MNVSEKMTVARSFYEGDWVKTVVSSFSEGELVYNTLLKLLFTGLRLEKAKNKKIDLVDEMATKK